MSPRSTALTDVQEINICTQGNSQNRCHSVDIGSFYILCFLCKHAILGNKLVLKQKVIKNLYLKLLVLLLKVTEIGFQAKHTFSNVLRIQKVDGKKLCLK